MDNKEINAYREIFSTNYLSIERKLAQKRSEWFAVHDDQNKNEVFYDRSECDTSRKSCSWFHGFNLHLANWNILFVKP